MEEKEVLELHDLFFLPANNIYANLTSDNMYIAALSLSPCAALSHITWRIKSFVSICLSSFSLSPQHKTERTDARARCAVDLFFCPPTEPSAWPQKHPYNQGYREDCAGQDLPAMRNHWTVTSRKILDTRTGTLARARAREAEEEEEEFTGRRLRSSHKSQSHLFYLSGSSSRSFWYIFVRGLPHWEGLIFTTAATPCIGMPI